MKTVRRLVHQAPFTLGALLLALAVVLTAETNVERYGPVGGMFSVLFLAGIAVATWMFGWQSKLRFGPAGVIVVNGFYTSTIPWAAVEAVPDPGRFHLVLRGGARLGAVQFGPGIVGGVLGYPTHARARRIARDHLDRHRAGAYAHVEPLPLRFRQFAPPYVGIAVLLALVVLVQYGYVGALFGRG